MSFHKVNVFSFYYICIIAVCSARHVDKLQCLSPAEPIDGHCLQFTESETTFSDSRNSCENLNGHLLTMKELKSNEKIKTWINKKEHSVNEVWMAINPTENNSTTSNCPVLNINKYQLGTTLENKASNCNQKHKAVCLFEMKTQQETKSKTRVIKNKSSNDIIEDYDYSTTWEYTSTATSTAFETTTGPPTTTLSPEICYTPSCPEPFVQLSTGCYYFSDGFVNLNWWSASEECIRNDAFIVTLGSGEFYDVQNHLELISAAPTQYFIGATNQGHPSDWVWVSSGLTVDETGGYWVPGYPTSNSNYNCAALEKGNNWYWINLDCSTVTGYICKRWY